jgi:hypothetical protein
MRWRVTYAGYLVCGWETRLPLAQFAGGEGVDADSDDDCDDRDQERNENFGDGIGSQIVGLLSVAGEEEIEALGIA